MADFYFGASTSDWASNWAPIGGAGPDPTIMNTTTGFTFTVPTGGIIITELARGMDSAPSQAGGTFNIGVYDITSGLAGATLLGQATVNCRSDNAGYVWHTVTGLNISVAAGKVLSIAATPPTVQCWHTREADVQDYYTPGSSQTTLSSTWTANGIGRAIPLRAGYSLAVPPPTLYDLNGNNIVKVGSSGNTISTAGLGTLTSLTIGGVSATSLSAPGGDGTFSFPGYVDGVVTSLLSTVTAVAGDGTNTANRSVTLQPTDGWSYVTLSGTLNSSNTGILYNFSPAAVTGDQIVFESGNVIVDAQGNIETDTNTTLWHIQASTGVARSVAVTVIAGGSTATPSGTSLSLQVGTAVARGSASATPTGRSLSLVVGTATASGGAGSPGNATPSGVSVSLQVGTSVGRGSATASPTGVSLSLTNGTPTARGAAIVQAIGVAISLVSGLISFPRTGDSPNLPTFLVESVSKLRKTFRKSFRKK